MGNLVTYDAVSGVDPIEMSNGYMSVFIAVLCLAASDIAKTEREYALSAWLASRDQNIFGLGTVGFDLAEDFPWQVETWLEDKSFLLKVAQAAKEKSGWDRLPYSPGERIIELLNGFYSLVSLFDIRDAGGDPELFGFTDFPPQQISICPEHRIYRHEQGCVICNDMMPDQRPRMP